MQQIAATSVHDQVLAGLAQTDIADADAATQRKRVVLPVAALNMILAIAPVEGDHIRPATQAQRVVTASAGKETRAVAVLQHVAPRTAIQCIETPAAQQRIVTALAQQDIVPRLAIQTIVAAVADQQIAQLVAITGVILGAYQRQRLDLIGQRETSISPHRIEAAAGLFDDDILAVGHQVQVVAALPDQRIDTGATIEDVVISGSRQRIRLTGADEKLALRHDGCHGQRQRTGCRGTAAISGRELQADRARIARPRRTRQRAGRGVQAQPGRQGRAVKEVSAVAENVIGIGIDKGARRQAPREQGAGIDLDRAQCGCQDRRMVDHFPNQSRCPVREIKSLDHLLSQPSRTCITGDQNGVSGTVADPQIRTMSFQHEPVARDSVAKDNVIACRIRSIDDRIETIAKLECISVRAIAAFQQIVAAPSVQAVITAISAQPVVQCSAVQAVISLATCRMESERFNQIMLVKHGAIGEAEILHAALTERIFRIEVVDMNFASGRIHHDLQRPNAETDVPQICFIENKGVDAIGIADVIDTRRGVCDEYIVALTPDKTIVAGTANQDVIPRTAVQCVVARASIERIVAAAPGQSIVTS